MFVKSFGLFWRCNEVNWSPGRGHKFRLLGRRNANRPALRVADFQEQAGIYILYGDYGPHYVGLTKNLGKRLKAHRVDEHEGCWDRFSWFGFRKVLIRKDDNGLCELSKLAKVTLGKPDKMIRDVEALLIHSMALNNSNTMNFCEGDCWEQIRGNEVNKYLDKVA